MVEFALGLESARVTQIFTHRLKKDRRLRKSQHDLQDALQTTFVRAINGWAHRKDTSPRATESWCATLSDRTTIDGAIRRARRREVQSDFTECASTSEEPWAIASRREECEQMRKAAHDLQAIDRILFEILVVESLDPIALGQLLGVSSDSARMRRNRLYERMREAIERLKNSSCEHSLPIRLASRRRIGGTGSPSSLDSE